MAVGSTALMSAVGLDDYAEPGRLKVEVQRLDWHDAKRDRDVPVTVYFPQRGTNNGPSPVWDSSRCIASHLQPAGRNQLQRGDVQAGGKDHGIDHVDNAVGGRNIGGDYFRRAVERDSAAIDSDGDG